MLRMERYGTCQCKHQPTPEPPKQCRKIRCWNDEDCGDGGVCRIPISKMKFHFDLQNGKPKMLWFFRGLIFLKPCIIL